MDGDKEQKQTQSSEQNGSQVESNCRASHAHNNVYGENPPELQATRKQTKVPCKGGNKTAKDTHRTDTNTMAYFGTIAGIGECQMWKNKSY